MFNSKRRHYTNIDDPISEPGVNHNLRKFNGVVAICFFTVFLGSLVLVVVSRGNSKGVNLLEQGEQNLTAGDNTTTTVNLRLSLGRLEGIVLKSRGGRNYSAFYNIPYSRPPTNDLRFEPPQEFNERWKGTRDATRPGPKCMQTSISGEGSISGQEDCLYLTVYSPKLPGPGRRRQRKEDLLPVMVYLLGGAFVKGQASIYSGDYLMDKDVVVVLPETRIGILAFFTTGDAVIPGNMGFHDQTRTLRWVQANIEKFGGDPKKVTIFGNSSGALSVHAHMMSNMSTGLFNAAISQSGVAISRPSQVLENPRQLAEEIGTKMGCPVVNDTRQLADCLKSANATELLSFANKNVKPLTIENSSELAFMSDLPLKLMREGNYPGKDIPWILGVNSNEYNILAAALTDPEYQNQINTDFENMASDLLDISDRNISKQIKEFYFGNETISNETRTEFTDMKNDREFVHPTYLAASLHATQRMGNVYLYMLSKRPVKSLGSFLETLFEPPHGVTHADEVQYLFPYLKFPYIGKDSADFKMSERMVDLWTTFAETGNPHEIWEPVQAGQKGKEVKWLQLDENITMINFAGERMEFWDSLPSNSLYA